MNEVEEAQTGPEQPKTHFLYSDQVETFYWMMKRLENYAETLEGMCKHEKDDISYGFELGRLHTHMREDFMNLMEFEQTIKEQKL